jgi:Icc-related predicted phosphoesterase
MKLALTSDLHGKLPSSVPSADLLVIAGDVCPDFYGDYEGEEQLSWLVSHFAPWAESMAIPIVMVWGNHDFVGQYQPQRGIVKALPGNVTLLNNSQAELFGKTFYGTSYVLPCGRWAFTAAEEQIREHLEYAARPDVMISHGPPWGFGDRCYDGRHAGSMALLHWIERKQPSLLVCGHIHEAAGSYSIDNTRLANVAGMVHLVEL